MKKKIGDLTLKEAQKICEHRPCGKCPLYDLCQHPFSYEFLNLDQEIEVEETENNICNICRLNNYCPMNHEPNLQCPITDYEKR